MCIQLEEIWKRWNSEFVPASYLSQIIQNKVYTIFILFYLNYFQVLVARHLYYTDFQDFCDIKYFNMVRIILLAVHRNCLCSDERSPGEVCVSLQLQQGAFAQCPKWQYHWAGTKQVNKMDIHSSLHSPHSFL